MMPIQKSSRPVALAFAAVVALITSAVVGNAVQTCTVPNAALVSYNLVPGANSAAITPPANVPVHVAGTCTTLGRRGVGNVTLLRIAGSFLEWTGLNSPAGASIASGFSGAAGFHIVYIDWLGQVDLEVNSPDTFRVHNGWVAGSPNATGYVSMIW